MTTSDTNNRVVVVTGGSAGIGRAIVQEFGRQKASVAILARGRQGVASAAAEVEASGGRAVGIPTDVTDFQAVEKAASEVEERLGPIDVWVNVAFTSVFAPFTEISPDEYRRVTEVAYLGYVYGTQVALSRMLPRDRGVIIQVGSALAKRSIPLQSAYCGAKHAIVGFTESVRCELINSNSRVKISVVQMPGVNTPQFSWVLSRLPRHPQPVPPIYQPEVAAAVVAYAADHPRKEIWVGGSTVATLLAQKFAAPLLDRYLGRTGFQSQQTDQPADPHRRVNLWEPVDGTDTGDYGAHGIFDDRSHGRSYQTWATTHRGAVAAGAAGVGAAIALITRRQS
jgi:NAD(P)-dependent dehydrogenase (short-subunit alcohol dehydrogenase family)